MKRSRIIGIGAYVPDNIVTNKDLETMMNTSDDWIVKRTGIRERRWVSDGKSTSDLALEATKIALHSAGLDKSKIDCIIFATISPDHDFPGSACFLQAKLDIPGIAAIDIRQQCSGFIYGLSIADQYIRSGMYKNILLLGAEYHSIGLDKTSRGRDISVLFGDGAGAVILSACDVGDLVNDSYIYSTHLHADGRFAKNLWLEAPGTATHPDVRINEEMIRDGKHFPFMDGKKVFVHAVEKMGEVLHECLNFNKINPSEVDLFLFHQANLRINEAVADKFHLNPDKIFNTIQKYGNTTAATIPLGMYDAVKEGKLKKGMLVATAAFGSGFTWAASLLRY